MSSHPFLLLILLIKVLNIVATITNLSFYHHINNVLYLSKQAILRSLLSLSLLRSLCKIVDSGLLPLLFSDNQEMVTESVRALGNFSRDADFRADMLRTRGEFASSLFVREFSLPFPS